MLHLDAAVIGADRDAAAAAESAEWVLGGLRSFGIDVNGAGEGLWKEVARSKVGVDAHADRVRHVGRFAERRRIRTPDTSCPPPPGKT